MNNLEKRLSRLEQPTPEPLKIERIIIDNQEQRQHQNRFRKVVIYEDSTRKIFELERK